MYVRRNMVYSSMQYEECGKEVHVAQTCMKTIYFYLILLLPLLLPDVGAMAKSLTAEEDQPIERNNTGE